MQVTLLTMRNFATLLVPIAVFATGCTATVVDDERQNTGPGNPASIYCKSQGYTSRLTDSNCVFPDATSCGEFAFYRGECGQTFSYCNKKGGKVRAVTSTTGGSTSAYAVCALNGVDCKEQDFLASGVCK
jgi:putative hemolysin